MKSFALAIPDEVDARVERLERQLARERGARLEAEAIAEKGLRELYEKQQWLSLLQRITDGANRARDIGEAFALALREICCQMGWDFGNAYLVDAATGEARACDSWYAALPDSLFAFVEASRRACFAVGEGLPGRVVADRHAHWIDDARADKGFVRRLIAEDCDIHSACAFPILIGDEIAGLMEFFSRKTLVGKEDLVGVMAQVGLQLGHVVERDRSRAALLHDALHDAMTGLPNRVLLQERSEAAFERRGEGRRGMALLVIDLDGFKAVNDHFGHHAGDTLLIEVASRFRGVVAKARAAQADAGGCWHATLARVGGDEFVILLDGLRDDTAPTRLAEALHRSLVEPVAVAGDEVSIHASIGIALSAPDYADVEQMLRDADLAMYEAKTDRRHDTVAFTSRLGEQVRNRMSLERELRDAIREGQFVLHYQPIFDLGRGGALQGFEALIRWNHPTRGLVQPNDFIPTAEKCGLIIFIGDWVLREACAAISRLHRLGSSGERPFMAINIAPLQFLQPNFIQQVQKALLDTGVEPGAIKLEVTEGVAIIDAVRTREVLDQCRAWGVKTGLDDFGTGYSSLSYLHTLPFDTLKIDRSFIASLDQPKSRSIVRTILDLADNLALNVVAEGIETAEQGGLLEEMGCRFGQGFLLGRPLPEGEACQLLAA